LLTHLVQAYCEPEEVLEMAEDLFSAGKVHADLGEYEQAIRCFNRSLNILCSPHLKQEILTHLSYIYKRLGRLEDACSIWQHFIQSNANMRLLPYVEMAKYFEHHGKDYQRALEVTESARELLVGQRRHYTAARFNEWMADLDHRRERLQKKCIKQGKNFVQLHI
jgi:tetratricopeptide (TPR) repeat protein